jgi:hyperosmotically inducible protein
MRNGIKMWVMTAILAVPAFAASEAADANPDLDKQVRQAINKLAYYSVFDDLSYSISEAGIVTISGQVTQYTVRNSALAAVSRLTGVVRVEDKIEVLPLSPFDNNIRLRAYNAIFGYPALSRYAINARPPIRILVKNGNITITGVVNNDLDRKLVYSRIRALPGAFTVTNGLRLDSDPAPQPVG